MNKHQLKLSSIVKQNDFSELCSGCVVSAVVSEGISLTYKAVVNILSPKLFSAKTLSEMIKNEAVLEVSCFENSSSRGRTRNFFGIVTSASYKGIPSLSVEDMKVIYDSSNQGKTELGKYMYQYEVVIEPSLIKADYVPKTRFYKGMDARELIVDLLKKYDISACFDDASENDENDTVNNVIFYRNFIYQQTQETDLEFIRRLCSIFCMNYMVSAQKNEDGKFSETVKFIKDTVYPADNAVSDLNIADSPVKNSGAQWEDINIYSSSDDVFAPSARYENYLINSDLAVRARNERAESEYLINYSHLPAVVSQVDKPVFRYFETSAVKYNKATSYCSEVKGKLVTDNLMFVPGMSLNYLADKEKIIEKHVIARSCIECIPQVSDNRIFDGKGLCEGDSSIRIECVVTPFEYEDRVAKYLHYSRYMLSDSLESSLEIERKELQGIGAAPSAASGTSIVEGRVCDMDGSSDSAGNVCMFQETNSSPSSFYVRLKDAEQSVVVAQYVSVEGSEIETGNLPYVGENVFLLKQGQKFYLLGYRPSSLGSDVYDGSIRDIVAESKQLRNKKSSGKDSGLSFVNITSPLARIRYLILKGEILNFVDDKCHENNSTELADRFASETFSGTLPSVSSPLSLEEAVVTVRKNIEDASAEYDNAKEQSLSAQLNDIDDPHSNAYKISSESVNAAKRTLSDAYDDLNALAVIIKNVMASVDDPRDALTEFKDTSKDETERRIRLLESNLASLNSRYASGSDSAEIEDLKKEIESLKDQLNKNSLGIFEIKEDEITLRANRSLVIESGGSITLKTTGTDSSSITIDSASALNMKGASKIAATCGTANITVKDDNINLNASIFDNCLQPWTSSVVVNSLSGVTVNGPSINVNPTTMFKVCDMFGAEFKLSYGKISLGGLTISSSTMNSVDFGLAMTSVGKYLVDGVSSLVDDGKEGSGRNKASKVIKSISSNSYSFVLNLTKLCNMSYKKGSSLTVAQILDGIAFASEVYFAVQNLMLEIAFNVNPDKFSKLGKKNGSNATVMQGFKMAQQTLAITCRLASYVATVVKEQAVQTTSSSMSMSPNAIQFATANLKSATGIKKQEAVESVKLTANYGMELGVCALAVAPIIALCVSVITLSETAKS